MAISVKVDTEDFPSIISMLGLGGSSPSAPTPDSAASPEMPPPVDSSMGGADDPAGQPDTSNSIPDAAPAKNKLQTLREFLSGNNSTDAPVPVPPLQVPGQSSMPPADLAESEAAGTAHIKPTFREAHPLASTLLRVALNAGQGGLVGSQYANAGEGFQAAKQATDPIRKKIEDAALAEKQAAVGHIQAITDQMKTMVRINGVDYPYDLAKRLFPTMVTEEGKNSRNAANIDSRESIAGDKNALALRKQGLKIDPTGKQVPLSRDEMSESEQATLDLKQSQQDAAAARAELDRQKNNPDSPAYKAAMGRLAVAQKNADTAAGRLGIETKKYMGDYFGTDDKGNPLPGAPTDDSGKPIGTRVANTGAASADRLKRGDLARNATQNANSIQQIVANRPDLFGAIAGRITSVQQMLGSDDPDIARLGVEIHNLALASNGAHGVRSAQAVHDTENEIINRWRAGPTAVGAALDSMKQSLGTFIEDQKHGKRPVPATTGTAQTAPSGKYSDLGFVPVQPKK